MKQTKLSLLFILFTLLISNLSALDAKGAKLGLNLSTLTGGQADNAKVRPNLTAGFYLTQRLNNWLVLQPEVLYIVRGSFHRGTERLLVDDDMDGSFSEDPFDLLDNDGDGLIDEDKEELDFEVNGHYQLSYLEIPLLLKASTEGFFSKNINLVFGPSFNFLLDGKYKLKQEGYSYHTGDLSDLNSFEIQGVLGLEYSSGKFSIELRANQGFTENEFISTGEVIMRSLDDSENYFAPFFEDYEEFIIFQEVKGYNTSVSLILGYSF